VSAYELFCAWTSERKQWCGCMWPPVQYYAIENGPLVIRCDGCGVTWTYEDEWGVL
jgi:hypothetical protein